MCLLGTRRYPIPREPPWRNAAIAAILFLIFLAILGTPARGEASKSVLVLNSYGPDFAPYNFLTLRLRDDLASAYGGSIDFYDASLASARFAADASEKPFVDYLQSLFEDHPLDLIIAIGAPAARFVQTHRSTLFPKVPMLL